MGCEENERYKRFNTRMLLMLEWSKSKHNCHLFYIYSFDPAVFILNHEYHATPNNTIPQGHDPEAEKR